MDEAELMRQLLAAFAMEAEEHLRDAARLLVELETTVDGSAERADRIGEIFRLVHSLKGAARAVSLGEVQALSHAIESLLGAAKAEQIVLGQAHIDLLLKGIDHLESLVAASLARQPIGDRYLSVLSDLEAAKLGRLPPTIRAAVPERQAAPPLPEPDSTQINLPVQPPAQPAHETIRVRTQKLDALLGQVGELVTAKLRADGWAAEVKALSLAVQAWTRRSSADGGAASSSAAELKEWTGRLKALAEDAARQRSRLSVVTAELQDSVRQLRMLPFATITATLPKVVRDLARDLDKKVRLELAGVEAEVDKRVLDEVNDDLLHLIRNAIDHGIESPDERLRAGKPATGTVQLSAKHQGSQLLLELRDDGRGVDLAAVKRVALVRGVVTETELAAMSDTEALHLVFRPDFSTRREVTNLSGRGVGLDVVRKQVERLNGRLAVETAAGQWTVFRLTLPLTVATTEGLLVQAGGATLALPAEAIERIIAIRVTEITLIAGRPAIMFHGAPIALARLSELLGRPSSPPPPDAMMRLPVVIIASAEQRAALLVDTLVGNQEMVVKPLGRMLVRVRNVSGATILASGEPVIVLNPADLIKSALSAGNSSVLASPSPTQPAKQRILVADDSITTRTLERMILESAGYTVRTAVDGQEAWELLQTEQFDLVVSDVDMPGMTGLTLTWQIRANDRTRALPVILVTSLDSQEEKEQGLSVGADAYLVKSAFDQGKLLAIVRQFL